MKALLLIETDSIYEKIKENLKRLGVEAIRYRIPQKAMDNLEEISPHIIIMSASDFPRHWKVIVQYLKYFTQNGIPPIILLKNSFFNETEADKALFLKVKAIVDDKIEIKDLKQINEIILRYKPETGSTAGKIIKPSKEMPVQCIFSNPVNNQIITGEVESISDKEIFFNPDSPAAVKDIENLEELIVLLKINNKKIQCKCKAVLLGKSVRLIFRDDDKEITGVIDEYLSKNLNLWL